MHAEVTVTVNASASAIWALVADVRRTSEYSPEVFEAEWLPESSGPAVGAMFRGHVKRNEKGPIYWTTCRVTACVPDREFGFEVLMGDQPLNNWHYGLTPRTDGTTEVAESFRMNEGWVATVYAVTGLGLLRTRRNRRDMRRSLHRIKALVENETARGGR